MKTQHSQKQKNNNTEENFKNKYITVLSVQLRSINYIHSHLQTTFLCVNSHSVLTKQLYTTAQNPYPTLL